LFFGFLCVCVFAAPLYFLIASGSVSYLGSSPSCKVFSFPLFALSVPFSSSPIFCYLLVFLFRASSGVFGFCFFGLIMFLRIFCRLGFCFVGLGFAIVFFSHRFLNRFAQRLCCVPIMIALLVVRFQVRFKSLNVYKYVVCSSACCIFNLCCIYVAHCFLIVSLGSSLFVLRVALRFLAIRAFSSGLLLFSLLCWLGFVFCFGGARPQFFGDSCYAV